METDKSGHLQGLETKQAFGEFRATPIERLIWKLSDWSGFPQSLRRRLRKRFARKVKGPFDLHFEGMNFRLYPAENYCDRVIFGRRDLPERAEHEALLPFIFPGMVFIDIGANIGSYSAFVGTRALGDLTLLALEPHPRTFEKLVFNLRANELPVSNVINCGVGPQRETLTLWSDGGSNIGHTSLLKDGTSNAKVGVDVPVAPLADLLTENGIDHIDLLKIDIEGFEDRALAPFFDSAPDELSPDNVLIETAHKHLWERDLLEMLVRRGYTKTFQTAENILFSRGGR